MNRLRVAVIPTNGRDCVDRAIAAVDHQVHWIVVVESGPSITRREYTNEKVVVLQGGPELNISHWWNVGIDWAAEYAQAAEVETWDVAVINDDVILPTTWMCYVADDMRALGCVAACSGARIQAPIIHRQAAPVDVFTRLQGFAFVLAGESGLRLDEENFTWYFGDDDLGARAAAAGGMAMMPGCDVQHLYPNSQVTGEIQVQIGSDGQRFREKWGWLPW